MRMNRFFVQSIHVRGEPAPRYYRVEDRAYPDNLDLPGLTTDRRVAERQCAELNRLDEEAGRDRDNS